MSDPRHPPPAPRHPSAPPPAPQHAHPAPPQPPRPRPGGALIGFGIAGICVGSLVVLVSFFIAALPMLAFLLGGGGNVDAFGEFANPVLAVAGVTFAIGAVLLIGGVVMLVQGRRRRRGR